MPKDYYSVLGIKRDASPQEIKVAFKTMARTHHPDKPGGSEETMKHLNEAYYILRNPHKRKMYDLTGRADSSDVPTFTGSGEYIYFEEPKDIKEKDILYLIQHVNSSLTLKDTLRSINKMIEIVKVRNDLAPLMVETAIQEKRGGLNSYLFDALSDCVPSPFEQKHVDALKQYRDKAQARSEWDRCNNSLQAILQAMKKHKP
jgi:curved DNA-binding protein CbpA